MSQEIREIEVIRVQPNRRLIFEEEAILRLCQDIKTSGLREPIRVEWVEYWFQIIEGEQRWRACKKIGLSKVRVIIQETSESY